MQTSVAQDLQFKTVSDPGGARAGLVWSLQIFYVGATKHLSPNSMY